MKLKLLRLGPKVSCSRRACGLVIAVSVLQGCSTTSGEKQAPPQWLTDYSNQKVNSAHCQAPVGTYWVVGSTSDRNFDYPLHHILFEDRLAGYPVEQIQINESDDKKGLKIRGVLAGVPLSSSVRVAISEESCEKQWFLKVDSGAVDSQLRTEAILWTGGLLFPISETNHVYLIRAQDGALLIHLFNEAWILGALSIPFRVEKEVWLRFVNVESATPASDQPSEQYSTEVHR